MKPANRIIKDIRFYENKPKDFAGDFNGIIGNVYKITPDTTAIAQRIARKLNELGFVSGVFDHIYITFANDSKTESITESDQTLDQRIKYLKYGINPTAFNSLDDRQKDLLVKKIIFEALNQMYREDHAKIAKVTEVENLLSKFETAIEIAHKTKETDSYKIEVGYRINSKNGLSEMVVKYFDKKAQTQHISIRDLYHYEDIFYLADKIGLQNNIITIVPKKSSLGEIATAKYQTPVEIEILKMEKA